MIVPRVCHFGPRLGNGDVMRCERRSRVHRFTLHHSRALSRTTTTLSHLASIRSQSAQATFSNDPSTLSQCLSLDTFPLYHTIVAFCTLTTYSRTELAVYTIRIRPNSPSFLLARPVSREDTCKDAQGKCWTMITITTRSCKMLISFIVFSSPPSCTATGAHGSSQRLPRQQKPLPPLPIGSIDSAPSDMPKKSSMEFPSWSRPSTSNQRVPPKRAVRCARS